MTTTLYNIIKAHEEGQRIQFNRIFSKREYFYRFSIIFYCYLKILFYICGINETSYRDKRRTGSHYLEKSNAYHYQLRCRDGQEKDLPERVIGTGGNYSGQSLCPENGKGEGHPFQHAGSHLQGAKLPAGRYYGVERG